MTAYSPLQETQRIFHYLCENGDQLGLPASIQDIKDRVTFVSNYNRVYFPIPFKEMEVASALKAVEGSVACALADLKFGKREREVCVNLEKATNFLFQAYRATVDGLGKLDPKVKSKLKGRTCEVRSRFVLLAEHLSLFRYRLSTRAIRPISTYVSQSIRNQDPWRLLPYPRIP